ncbi:helix-turn-helix domain-containing protein [Paenibacillus whitsoniae]|uniref:AraC family transcriptional regulator n=1 Tax=Paenibacillus whitsoniae TaxID=2496558 RepID=A0A3S0AJT4_9BACL|nr:helix-turn-helix domain-containing protein [Paenibacillus whitsoniae]RTE01760.1 AraC family transcriptional regulator [Paenibacillus whitsoniae]
MKSHSYLRKLIVLTLVVGAFPVLILGWYSYTYSSHTVLEKVNESNAQILRQTQLRVEQTLKTIDYTASQMLNTPLVAGAIGKRLTIMDTELINDLYDNLLGIQTFELGIRDVFLFSLENDWLISNSGFNEDSQAKMKELLRGFTAMQPGSKWVSLDLSGRYDTESPIVSNNYTIMNVKKWPINSQNPQGLMAILLSGKETNNLIDLEDADMGQIYIVDETNKLVAHQNRSLVGTDLSHEEFMARIVASKEATGLFKAKVGEDDMSVSYRKSAYNGWTYVSVLPISEMTQRAKSIAWTSLWVSLIALCTSIVIAVLGTRSVYRPVRSIYRSLAGAKTSREAKDEFGVISEGIQSLLSTQSRMQFQLEGQQAHMTELLVRKMVTGEAKSSEIQERLQYYGYTLDWDRMRVLLFQIDDLADSRFDEKDRDLLLYAIANMVSELVPSEARLAPIIFQDAVLLITGAQAVSEEAFKERVYDMAASVQEEIKRYLSVEASVGISRSFTQWMEAEQGYAECVAALKYRVQLGREAVLFSEDVQPKKSKDMAYPKESAAQVIDAIQSSDKARAQEALAAFIDNASKSAEHHNDYQLSLVRLLVDLIRLLQDAGISLYALNQRERTLFDELLHLHAARDIEAWFYERIVEPSIGLLEERRDTQFRTISDEVKRLIEEAFDTDLTLEKCAARINYHPQYISRVFRQETGINFAEYLAQYRLGVAKRWLRETNMTVTDIAEKLNYNNPANFIRYFRKMEGITPGQYREKPEK